jgi:hypothetical protein
MKVEIISSRAELVITNFRAATPLWVPSRVVLYVNRPGILPTIIENGLPHDPAGFRSILRFDRTGIDSHDVVLARGNEERFAIGDTNASSRASLLNKFGIGTGWKPDPHIDAIRTGPASTPARPLDLIQGGTCALPTVAVSVSRFV